MRQFGPLWSSFRKVAESTKKYSNLPDAYIKRAMQKVYWRNPRGVNFRPGVALKQRIWRFTTARPWTDEHIRANEGPPRPVLVEPLKSWDYFRGDRVEILSGPDRGKQGLVCQLFEERNWIVVEGLNCEYKRVGKIPGDSESRGVLVKTEKPLLVNTEVALVDPADKKPTEVEWRFTEEGEKVRVSLRTGRIVPVPTIAEETYDYKTAASYKENEIADTSADVVSEVNFTPKLKTFEMDVAESLGVKPGPVPFKTFWY